MNEFRCECWPTVRGALQYRSVSLISSYCIALIWEKIRSSRTFSFCSIIFFKNVLRKFIVLTTVLLLICVVLQSRTWLYCVVFLIFSTWSQLVCRCNITNNVSFTFTVLYSLKSTVGIVWLPNKIATESGNVTCWWNDYESVQPNMNSIRSPANVKMIVELRAHPNEQCNCHCCCCYWFHSVFYIIPQEKVGQC
jgi:hypothetical protein